MGSNLVIVLTLKTPGRSAFVPVYLSVFLAVFLSGSGFGSVCLNASARKSCGYSLMSVST